MMRTSLLAAVLAFHMSRGFQRVMRTTHVAARLGYLLFRYGHNLSLSNANDAPLRVHGLMQAWGASGKKAAYLIKLPAKGKPCLGLVLFYQPRQPLER